MRIRYENHKIHTEYELRIDFSPIYIDGNNDFTQQAAVNGWDGSGTPEDPYVIENYTIDASSAHGINIQNTNISFIVRNCTIYNGGSSYMGIRFYNISNGMVDNCVIYNNSYGIYLNTVDNISVSLSDIHDNVNYGIIIDDSANTTISRNRIYNSTNYGMYIYQATNIEISNNYVFQNDYGVYLYSTELVNISLNEIFNNTNHGIYIKDTTAVNYIFGNRIYNNKNGAYLSSVQNITLAYNEIFNNSYNGIYLYRSIHHTIKKSNIYNNLYGVYMNYYYPSYVTLSNNSIHNNEKSGIYIYEAERNTIYQNYVYENANTTGYYEGGISLREGSYYNIILRNNIYNNHDYGGIYFYRYSNATVHNNNIVGNRLYGLYSYSTSSSYPVNATDNWWGAVDGPSLNGPGSGDSVGGTYVAYEPWLSEPVVTIPSQPEGLTFIEGAGHVNLTWMAPQYTDGAAISHYHIYRDGKLIAKVTSNQHYYDDTSGELGIIHTYFVTAVNSKGESPVSNIIKARLLRIPSPPLNLAASTGNAFVNLTWDPPSFNGGYPITKYKVYRYSALIAEVSTLWYNDTGLINGHTYEYYITAVNAAGEGEKSDVIEAIPQTIPSAPKNLDAHPGYTYINLTWMAPDSDGGASITEYRIYRNDTFIGSVPPTRLWFNDTNVQTRITYNYYVTAVNIKGESERSNIVSTSLIKTPSAPRNLAVKCGDSYVNITWDVPKYNGGYEITSYKIYRDGTYVASVPQTQLWYNDTGLNNGENYSYYVTAGNSIGEGEKSATIYGTPYTVPNPPENLKATPGNRYINLSWSPPSFDGGAEITEYKIYRNNSLIATVSAEQLWYNDMGLINGISYTYNVSAVNAAGESNRSNTITATPKTIPSAPRNLKAQKGYTYINISWDPPSSDGGSSITEYKIYRNGAFYIAIPSSKLWYNDTYVSEGNTYTYYVTAVNSVGESERSNEIQVDLLLAPTPPRNLQATTGGLYINLTWEIPSHDGGSSITEYKIYRNGVFIASIPSSRLWYNDTDVTPGVTYTYYVTAINSIGESNKSNEIEVTVPEIPEFADWSGVIIAAGLALLIFGKRKIKNA